MAHIQKSPWIYFNSAPGMGKVTIAKELLKLIPKSKLMHNHLIIDLVRTIHPQGSAPYEELRLQMFTVVLEALAKMPDVTVIFTGGHMIHNRSVPTHIENFIVSHDIPFIPVYLSCEKEEHMKRAMSEGRQGKKLTRESELLRIRGLELFRFDTDSRAIELDVTNLLPEEAAEKVRNIVLFDRM